MLAAPGLPERPCILPLPWGEGWGEGGDERQVTNAAATEASVP